MDNISTRYFQGFHRRLPVVSRTRFYNQLISPGAAPADDVAVLLLAICLIAHTPVAGFQNEYGNATADERESLHLTARSLLAQVQVSRSRSLPLIQAGLLLAVYEYSKGRPEDAFVTISSSIRMAYAAHINVPDGRRTQMACSPGQTIDSDLTIQAEEAANTWWGILVWERYVSALARQ